MNKKIIIAVSVVVIIGIIVGAVILMQPKNEELPTATTAPAETIEPTETVKETDPVTTETDPTIEPPFDYVQDFNDKANAKHEEKENPQVPEGYEAEQIFTASPNWENSEIVIDRWKYSTNTNVARDLLNNGWTPSFTELEEDGEKNVTFTNENYDIKIITTVVNNTDETQKIEDCNSFNFNLIVNQDIPRNDVRMPDIEICYNLTPDALEDEFELRMRLDRVNNGNHHLEGIDQFGCPMTLDILFNEEHQWMGMNYQYEY